jgi:hypothetical protein
VVQAGAPNVFKLTGDGGEADGVRCSAVLGVICEPRRQRKLQTPRIDESAPPCAIRRANA